MRKDIFFESKRFESVVKRLRKIVDLFGYNELFVPSVEEYRSSLRKGLKISYNSNFYLVRPDITSQIAVNLKRKEKMKLFYTSEVLDGGVKGNWQFGVEFIGGEEILMYVELIKVIILSLEELGIEDFYIDIGSLKVWREIALISGVEEERIFKALKRRNFEIIDGLSIEKKLKDKMWELFNFRGKESDYEKLNLIIESVDDERVFIDFGTIRPLPYYEDVIFEIYSPKIGHPIGGGGDYRINQFKSVGFAFDLRSLSLLASDNKERKGEKIKGRDLKELYKRACELVKRGIPVEIDYE